MIGLLGIGDDFVFWDDMYEWNWMVLQLSVVEIETDKHSACLDDYRSHIQICSSACFVEVTISRQFP